MLKQEEGKSNKNKKGLHPLGCCKQGKGKKQNNNNGKKGKGRAKRVREIKEKRKGKL